MSSMDGMYRTAAGAKGIIVKEAKLPKSSKRVVPWAMTLFVPLILALLAFAFTTGRDARARLDVAEAVTADQESAAFCMGIGFAKNGEAHGRCMKSLREIRIRQRERWEADGAGLL